MRKLALFLAVFATAALAQQEWSPESHLDGGVSQTLQSIYIPPIHDAPFAATVHTEWARPMAGGGTSTLVNSRRVMRDRDGRIYEERWALVPKIGDVKSVRNVIQIYDANEGTGYVCWLLGPKHGVCQLLNYTPSDSHEPPARPGRSLTGNGYSIHEDLGIKTIEGIEVLGSRDTRVVIAGAMGNDQEMKIVREYWHSPKLGVNLISILNDPRIGTETFTLSDIAVTEVDPKYFQLPEGFTVEDRRVQKPPEN
jgi:hypothetical protein